MLKIKTRTGWVGLAVVAALVTGCSTQARRVDCDGRLRPINAPASTSAPVESPEKAPTP